MTSDPERTTDRTLPVTRERPSGRIVAIAVVLVAGALLIRLRAEARDAVFEISGATMGTTYHVAVGGQLGV